MALINVTDSFITIEKDNSYRILEKVAAFGKAYGYQLVQEETFGEWYWLKDGDSYILLFDKEKNLVSIEEGYEVILSKFHDSYLEPFVSEDITSKFLEAKELNVDKCHYLKKVNEFVINKGFLNAIDNSVPESWGIVFRGNEKIAYYHTDLPILFVFIEYIGSLQMHFNNQSVVFIVIKDWELQRFSLNIKLLRDVIDWHSSIEPEGYLSIDDLYVATV